MHDPPRPSRPRHLHPVPSALQVIPDPRPSIEPRPTGRVRLGLWQRQEAEDARQLVYQLAEVDAAELAPARLAFTLGRLHGAALNLLDIIDAITEP